MELKETDTTIIHALKQNRKIEAIKLLRERENIGLKEAKQVVDAYLAQHPNLHSPRTSGTRRSYNGLLFLIALGCLLYLGYGYFA